MPVHVAFTPAEAAVARVGVVVDVIRASSSIAQALAAGYERVLCCGEIDEANALRAELGDEAVVGGERNGAVVAGFDVGASPREFAAGPRAPTLILSTTNGTAAILAAALLELGADPTVRDTLHDATPAGWADFAGNPELAARLREA